MDVKRVQSHIAIADLVCNVTAVMPGELAEWPRNIQDGIYAALERHSQVMGRKYTVYKSWSDNDIDTGPFVRVLAKAEYIIQ